MFAARTLVSDWFRLAIDLAIRDIQAKYKRSSVGLGWVVLTPLAMLGIYWTVFGIFLDVTWRDPETKQTVGFVLPFFTGLAFYLFFTDVVISSAGLFVSKRNYVIRSSFPIWVLWLANLIRAGITASVNFVILILLAYNLQGFSVGGLFWAVVALSSGVLFVSGMSLLLSCLGPFIGDIGDAAQLVLRILFYTAPVTYPLEVVPHGYRSLLWLNPLTHVIEPLRRAIVFSRAPDASSLILFVASAAFLLGVSLWVFHRTRGVIADVV